MQKVGAHELKAKQLRGDEFTLINTLSRDMFARTNVPHSINIPLEDEQFIGRVEHAIGGKDQEVVVYCASANCLSSTKAAQALEEHGFTHVIDFEEGAQGWKSAGMALAHPEA